YFVPERSSKSSLASAHIAGQKKEGWARVEVLHGGQFAFVVRLVPVTQLSRIDEKKGLLDEPGLVLIQTDKPVVVGLPARVWERDDILEQISLIQETPPSTARRTPPPPDMYDLSSIHPPGAFGSSPDTRWIGKP